MTKLRSESLSLAYANNQIVNDLSLAIPPAKITAIIGPNGCGKSTLLRGLGRLLTPSKGVVLLDGKAIDRLATKAVARQIGLLPQGPTAPNGIIVRDLVARGRYPHQSFLQQWSSEDADAVDAALVTAGALALADRLVDELSGGERQRVWIALVLAQQTEIMLLDEPTTFLDIAHQVEVLDLLANLNRNYSTTVVMVLHDINQAGRYADHIVALRDGTIWTEGSPAEVITERMIDSVFGLDARVIEDPVSHAPMYIPIGVQSTSQSAT